MKSWHKPHPKPSRKRQRTPYRQFSVDAVLKAIRVEQNDNYYDVYPGYSEPAPEYETQYAFPDKATALTFASKAIAEFDALPDPIPIYRAILSDSDKLIKDRPGESWSFTEDDAIGFGANNDSNILLEGRIPKNKVDWKKTLRRYALFSLREETKESEIVAENKGAGVKLIKITALVRDQFGVMEKGPGFEIGENS